MIEFKSRDEVLKVFKQYKNLIGNIVSAGLLFLTVAVVTLLSNNKQALAVSPNLITGTCGIIFNVNQDGWEAVLQGDTATNSAMGTINFTENTFALKFSNVRPYGSANNVEEIFITKSGSMIFQSYDAGTGIHEYNAIATGEPTRILHISVLPVNSKNTFLISAYSEEPNYPTTAIASGVCQKV